MEKLMEEWKIVHNMHDIEPQIVAEIDIEFVPDKYNKKEYPIINHDSFENIIKALDTNINLVDKKLTELEEPRDEIIVVKTFKEMLTDTEADEPSAGNPAVTGDMLYILRIPAIDSENPVREGVTNSVLADSLGHESGTGYIGENGNCVIAGHRNYTFGKFFNRLNEVEVNDLIYVDTAQETYTYAVKEIKVVEPDDLSVLESTPDKETLTLYTCTPIYIATHRLVIIAERI